MTAIVSLNNNRNKVPAFNQNDELRFANVMLYLTLVNHCDSLKPDDLKSGCAEIRENKSVVPHFLIPETYITISIALIVYIFTDVCLDVKFICSSGDIAAFNSVLLNSY